MSRAVGGALPEIWPDRGREPGRDVVTADFRVSSRLLPRRYCLVGYVCAAGVGQCRSRGPGKSNRPMQAATRPLDGGQSPGPETTLSQAELLACARLLAISVAEHRARFGVVPIRADFDPAREPPGTASAAWTSAALAALREALAVVRRSCEPAANPAPASMPARNDKRRQLRISVSTPVQVSTPDGSQTHAATLRNISWGGAALLAPADLGVANARVCLHLPAGGGQKIVILATILRARPEESGVEYGLRFDSLSPDDEDRLEKVLEILVAEPQRGGRRSEVRLVQRLEIEYGDAGELCATLEDISASGLMLTVPEPLEIDQSLLISLTSTGTDLGLNLRARVVHQTRIEEGGMEMYRIGLQFEHPTEQVRERVNAVVQQLATLRPHIGWREPAPVDPAPGTVRPPAAVPVPVR
jgi:c-di-GMP-binding flagellar brake protein YcgR